MHNILYPKDIGIEMQKKKKSSGELCRLMAKTFSRRQQWIKDEMSTVNDILLKYPALKTAKVVSQSTICLHNYYN